MCSHEIKITQICTKDGFVEHDPVEIICKIREAAQIVITALPNLGFSKNNIASIGITNQRETIVLWNKKTSKPLYNAVVWSDNRTGATVDSIMATHNVERDHFREIAGLPISSFASALKIRWLEQNVPSIREAILAKVCLAGTIDSWIVWNLIKELHITDCTNASRTLLMNLHTLNWDHQLCLAFKIDADILPEIRSSSEIYGTINDGSALDGVVISSLIGNQQASLVGQLCFKPGQAKKYLIQAKTMKKLKVLINFRQKIPIDLAVSFSVTSAISLFFQRTVS